MLSEATIIEGQEIVNEFSIFQSPLVGQWEKLHYISVSIYIYVIYICIYISMSILYEYLYTLSTSLFIMLALSLKTLEHIYNSYLKILVS